MLARAGQRSRDLGQDLHLSGERGQAHMAIFWAVPKEEVLAIFATAPVIDTGELRADLEDSVSEDLRDPYEGTGL